MTVPALYKYCAFSQHSLSSLVKRSAWFTDPTRFNDPFDCGFSIVGPDPKRFSMPLGVGLNLLVKNIKSWKETGKGIETCREYRQALTEALRNIGVFCLSSEPSNMLMWSHYCQGHRGFCLAFRYKADARLPAQEVRYGGEPVEFEIGEFAARQQEFIDRVIFTKSRYWEYEHEWRIVVDVPGGDDTYRLRPWSDVLILDRVFLGVRMPEEDKDTIRAVLRDEQVEIVEMEQVPGELQVRPKSPST